MPFDSADKIFRSEKTLLSPLEWISVESSHSSRKILRCRVALGDSIPADVWFRINVYPGSSYRMSFQLECNHPRKARKHIPLYRLDMSPLRAHTNKLYGGEDINGLFIPAGETHEHLFHDSLTKDGMLRENSCEQARLVTNPP
ncbi:MAG: DUF2794 domain-containing protein [Hyphomonadaceae bacterium]|nr:DUF2794 domain-containing protein [Hyphomonadaceae bacterium]